MNKWTIKALKETDDITFAMCILSERRKSLNPNAPFAQKLANTIQLLEKIRGGCPFASGMDAWETIRERIFREGEKMSLVRNGELNG